jgi:uncharacterized protein DUF4296
MRWVAGCMIILFLGGCTNHTKIPPGIIGKEKMEKILWDMIQADRYVSSFIMTRNVDSPSVKKEKAAIMYEKVFRLNGTTRDQFLKSYKFYLGRPDITKIMFDSISARAERQRGDLYKSKGSMLSKRDSLLHADSLRIADSIEKEDLKRPSTEELFADSVLDKKK